MMNIGVPGLIIILVLALIIFGPSELPQLGRAVGETLSEFKKVNKKYGRGSGRTIKRNKTSH